MRDWDYMVDLQHVSFFVPYFTKAATVAISLNYPILDILRHSASKSAIRQPLLLSLVVRVFYFFINRLRTLRVSAASFFSIEKSIICIETIEATSACDSPHSFLY